MILGQTQEFASPQEALEHYGVKGMRWGERKEEELVGPRALRTPPGNSSGRTIKANPVKITEYNRMAEDIVERAGIDPHLAAAKYGPPQMQSKIEKQRASDHAKLKKVALGLGLGVGAAGIGIAVYKLNQNGVDFNALPTERNKLQSLFGTSRKAYASGVDGLKLNWDHGVDLPQGFVLRRLSSVGETTPRPGGFFAAHLDADVESYKAILPTFWRQWGVGSAEAGGFINHYRAKEAVRAPSGKETFELFKHLIDTDDSFNAHFTSFWDANGARGYSETRLKKMFMDSSLNWADESNEFTKHWFSEVKKRGYNSLIDFNDAGKLGKTPLRVIDGTNFDIVKNEPQSLNDFYAAAKTWTPEMVHVLIFANGEHVIVHFGVSNTDRSAAARRNEELKRELTKNLLEA